MEITKQTPLLTGGDDQEKLRNTQGTDNLEENGNIALNAGGKAQTTTDNTTSRAVDQFFARQARGDILSPIKAGAIKDDAATESLDLKLDESCPSKSRSACVQPDSSMMEPTDFFEVNILETTVDSKLDADQSQTDLLNESASSRKRPQTEMEPAVFEVPRMTKHPHTDAPPVPEFREDSEPLIQFSSDTENVFRVALRGENADDTVEPMSFQEHSEVSTPGGERVAPFGETFDKCSATFDKEPAEGDAELLNDKGTQDGHKNSAGATASDASVAARSSPVPMKSEGSVSSSLLQSIDEALDPLVRAVFPIMRRRTGLNTAFVCIPLVVASIIYFYFRN